MHWISKIALLSLHLVIALALALVPFLLAYAGETTGGRYIGKAFLGLTVLTMAPWMLARRSTRRWFKPAMLVIGFLVAFCFFRAFQLAPSSPDRSGQFTERFIGDAKFRRLGLPNLVPEVDQLKLGSYLLSVTDPVLDIKQGERVRRLFMDVYVEMRRQADFVEGGSALGICYRDIFLSDRTPLHFYQYAPKTKTDTPLPVLVWLHGSLGNFKGYLWVLKDVADTLGVAIVAPTYGVGNWERDEDSKILKSVVDYCQSEPDLDGDQLYLGGISNGGRGCMLGLKNIRNTFRGLALISPVSATAVIESPGFDAAVNGVPILLLHGETDRRISLGYIVDGVESLKAMGANVEAIYYPNEDHFLMFSQRKEMVARITQWFERRRHS
ncbi:MAG: putative esterase [Verrucomicrobiales bacterium]